MTKENKKKIILVVEDDEAFRTVVAEDLISEGFEVLTGLDGENGLKLALAERPDLILLDLMMPKLNGIEFLKKLRQDEWGKLAPVILLTQVKETEKVAEALDIGISSYLVKSDHSVPEIIEKIKSLLGV